MLGAVPQDISHQARRELLKCKRISFFGKVSNYQFRFGFDIKDDIKLTLQYFKFKISLKHWVNENQSSEFILEDSVKFQNVISENFIYFPSSIRF